jgi:hypothetical protein
MDICYSDKDIKKLLDDDVKVVVYRDLKNYKDIENLLEPHGRAVILYETEDNFGHWCCVFYGPCDNAEEGKIYFFDSYGLPIDKQMNFVDKKFRIKNWDDFNHLSYLLKKTPIPVDYNQYQLQSFKPGVNSCGRWCVIRLIFDNTDTDTFNEIFKGDEEVQPDDIALAYTKKLENNEDFSDDDDDDDI